MNYYLKYNFQYQQVYDIIKEYQLGKVNFYIDLQSICTGFYNRDVVLMEVGRYATDGKISDILLEEFRKYLSNLWSRFQQYDPYFIIFFDDGRCRQNRSLQTQYKSKSSMNNMQVEIENIQLFRTIKKYYYVEITKRYNKKDVVTTFYLKDYEADFIPHYCIMKNLFDSQEKEVGNFILSKDKDLLQTCKFTNTFQIISGYKPSAQEKKYSKIFNDQNCIEYIYPNFKRGYLSAKHIPLILALTGDKSDEIIGINGIGPARAIQLIQDYNLPITIKEIEQSKKLPEIIVKNLDLIISNLKVIDFEEQISRIPSSIFKLEAQD